MSKISVCIATFNGEKYISEQLSSILSQLKTSDEVIISDDHSTDLTESIVNSFQDPRIKFFINKLKKGPVKNFENAISKATGEIIFLADQDDIWVDNKVIKILDQFNNDKKLTCVFSNAQIIDKKGNKTDKVFFNDIPKLNFISLILKNHFLGCTMAFKKNVNILPFNKRLPMHDWYIGLKHLKVGKVAFINENLVLYRRHGENVTTGIRSSFLQVLKWRIEILKALYVQKNTNY